MNDQQAALQELNDRFLAQLKSPLLKTATNVVPGDGSATAELMFIGEAPGKKEDESGKPFVGAAGKFLNEMLAAINLERSDVFITNIVKCRPPDNRDPLPEEIAEFWPWLAAQITLINPKLVITLGRHSLSALIPDQKISEVHGTVLRRVVPGMGKVNVYALYHPAAALYNGSMREVLLKDFKKIPRVIEKLKEV
ncbi:MAG: uracil-DNA glycosylase [Candidatus Buchananbacteria bacterium]|nr:uracil-DNA glycosylase [Candidatus Buchananbacteria bacterium]